MVLVTGGAKGLGLMIARAFVLNEASVYITSRDATSCERAAAGLNALGRGRAVAITADFYKESDVKQTVVELMKHETSKSNPLILQSVVRTLTRRQSSMCSSTTPVQTGQLLMPSSHHLGGLES